MPQEQISQQLNTDPTIMRKTLKKNLKSLNKAQNADLKALKIQKEKLEVNNLHLDIINKAYSTISQMIDNSGGIDVFNTDMDKLPEAVKIQLSKLGEMHVSLIEDLYRFCYNGKGKQDLKVTETFDPKDTKSVES